MNLNDVVRVRLTNAGLRRAAKWGLELGVKPGDEMSDGEKRGEWQLWRLMQVFGDAMYNGMPEPMFEKNELTVPGLNELRDRVHALAVSKGWYESRDVTDPNVLGSMLALIHSEVSEALEATRTIRNPARELYEDIENGDILSSREREEGQPVSRYKPYGLPSELADVIIRVLDMCGALGIDIENAVQEKHAFNETRSHRHGGKTL